jgi:hypothetical protein
VVTNETWYLRGSSHSFSPCPLRFIIKPSSIILCFFPASFTYITRWQNTTRSAERSFYKNKSLFPLCCPSIPRTLWFDWTSINTTWSKSFYRLVQKGNWNSRAWTALFQLMGDVEKRNTHHNTAETTLGFKLFAAKQLRPALLWNIMRRLVVVPYRRFGINSRFHFRDQESWRRNR